MEHGASLWICKVQLYATEEPHSRKQPQKTAQWDRSEIDHKECFCSLLTFILIEGLVKSIGLPSENCLAFAMNCIDFCEIHLNIVFNLMALTS